MTIAFITLIAPAQYINFMTYFTYTHSQSDKYINTVLEFSMMIYFNNLFYNSVFILLLLPDLYLIHLSGEY